MDADVIAPDDEDVGLLSKAGRQEYRSERERTPTRRTTGQRLMIAFFVVVAGRSLDAPDVQLALKLTLWTEMGYSSGISHLASPRIMQARQENFLAQ